MGLSDSQQRNITEEDFSTIRIADFIKEMLKLFDLDKDKNIERKPYYNIFQVYVNKLENTEAFRKKHSDLYIIKFYIQCVEEGHYCGYCSESDYSDEFIMSSLRTVLIAIPNQLIGNIYGLKIDDINTTFRHFQCYCGDDQMSSTVRDYKVYIPHDSLWKTNRIEPVMIPKGIVEGTHRVFKQYNNLAWDNSVIEEDSFRYFLKCFAFEPNDFEYDFTLVNADTYWQLKLEKEDKEREEYRERQRIDKLKRIYYTLDPYNYNKQKYD